MTNHEIAIQAARQVCDGGDIEWVASIIDAAARSMAAELVEAANLALAAQVNPRAVMPETLEAKLRAALAGWGPR